MLDREIQNPEKGVERAGKLGDVAIKYSRIPKRELKVHSGPIVGDYVVFRIPKRELKEIYLYAVHRIKEGRIPKRELKDISSPWSALALNPRIPKRELKDTATNSSPERSDSMNPEKGVESLACTR